MTVAPDRPSDSWQQGSPYERYIGRWSRCIAPRFVDWLGVPPGRRWVDVGCGTGADVAFLAKHGVHAIGLDYSRRAFARKQRKLAKRGLPATFRWANLTEVRSALVTGALLSREPGPRVVLARHVADATNADGRANLLRLARMALGGQGRLYLQVLSAPAPGGNPLGVHPIDVDALVAQVEASGGTVVARHDLAGERPGPTDPGATPYLCRLVVQWPQ